MIFDLNCSVSYSSPRTSPTPLTFQARVRTSYCCFQYCLFRGVASLWTIPNYQPWTLRFLRIFALSSPVHTRGVSVHAHTHTRTPPPPKNVRYCTTLRPREREWGIYSKFYIHQGPARSHTHTPLPNLRGKIMSTFFMYTLRHPHLFTVPLLYVNFGCYHPFIYHTTISGSPSTP